MAGNRDDYAGLKESSLLRVRYLKLDGKRKFLSTKVANITVLPVTTGMNGRGK